MKLGTVPVFVLSNWFMAHFIYRNKQPMRFLRRLTRVSLKVRQLRCVVEVTMCGMYVCMCLTQLYLLVVY